MKDGNGNKEVLKELQALKTPPMEKGWVAGVSGVVEKGSAEQLSDIIRQGDKSQALSELRCVFPSPVESPPPPLPKISGRDSKKEEEDKEEYKEDQKEDRKEVKKEVKEEVVKVVKVVSEIVKSEAQEEDRKQEKKLTEKEKAFCQEYLKDFNGTQSAIRAGYSENSAKEIAYENLTKHHIAQYLQQLIDKRAEKTELSAKWVLDNLVKVADRCLQQEPVLDSKGFPTGEYKFNSMGANKALELIGKHLGLFKEMSDKEPDQGFSLVILGDVPKKVDDK